MEEFYIKDESYCYYFIKTGVLTYIILFLKETSFTDIQNVKMHLKNLKDLFLEKDDNNNK